MQIFNANTPLSVPVVKQRSLLSQLFRLTRVCGLLIFAAGMPWQNVIADGPTQHRRPVEFSRDIKPLLSNTCFKCHGFDEGERKAGLRLDTEAGARAELASGLKAVVPGKSAESELITRITSTDPNEVMPPPGTGKSLTADQIDMLRRWVDEGAQWRGHWSFIPPTRPEPPAVTDRSRVINPIDQFVLNRLEADGLGFSPEADKVTLIRRATLDLTGLPPTPAEVDAFLADQSPTAYETVVDRLLASPRYGEHMARYWLDAARYGDTHGLHLDNERSMWLYREWVIAAFNNNQPFDQFAIEQIAGDLLPNPTQQQIIATGFNRCNVSTSEGGSIDEEVLVRYAVDRVETTSTVFLGLTAGCAVCHDHKYDPITQREFYQLYAFFSGVAEAAMDGNALSPPPVVKAPTAEQLATEQRLQQESAAVRDQIAAALTTVQYTDSQTDPAAVAPVAKDYVWIDDAVPTGGKAQANDGEWHFVSAPDHPVHSGTKSTVRTAVGLSQHFFDSAPTPLMIGEGDKLFAYVYLKPDQLPKSIMLQFNDGSWEHRAVWGEDVIPWGAAGSPSRKIMGPLPAAGEWVRLEVAASDVGLPAGSKLNGWAFTQHDGTVYWDTAGLVTKTPQSGQTWESQLAWEEFERVTKTPAVPQSVRDVLAGDRMTRTDEQKAIVRNYFIEHVYAGTRATFAPLHAKTAEVTQQLAQLDTAIPRTLVMAEMQKPRDTFILIRGQYDKKGEPVQPGVPAALPPLAADAPRNRLGLAQWLVSPQNPLTARVTVNRYWQMYFGAGLVKTAEDFGAQGAWPTHPELLDWLASEFVSSGWNVKAMQRLIVTSATYKQASTVNPEAFQRDPANELLARGSRFRQDAEVVRDSALFVSGLLREQIGGKSVKPYQPEGLWEAVAFVSSTTATFTQDHGDALYRRSLYTFWKRTSPPPSLLTFDAPSRETCTVRRARTNTPLQALVLMNDQQYVEAARHLAERVLAIPADSPAQRTAAMFRIVTSRVPTPLENDVLVRNLTTFQANYAADLESATKLLRVGESPRNEQLDPAEHAAWTMLANLLLNLDENVTRE